MNIESKYVTHKQAKLLKEKGFDIKTDFKYASNGRLCNKVYDFDDWCCAPEQWQVIEWLWLKHNIWIYTRHFETFPFSSYVLQKGESMIGFNDDNKGFDSPQAAYSAAFDYVLKNLI